MFYLKWDIELILLVTTHVNDCAVCGNPDDVYWFKTKLNKYFTLKELGQLKKHLGVWYEWNEDKIWILLKKQHGRFCLWDAQ